MKKPKLQLRAFVLALTTFSLMACIVAGAQAEVIVGGKKLTTEKTVKGWAHTQTNFLIPSKEIELLCTGHTIDEGVILANDEGHGAILLTNCVLFQKGVLIPACQPKEPVLATGHGKLFLHEGTTYILVFPNGEEPYARVDFPVTCVLPDTNIRGTAVAECLTPELNSIANGCEVERTRHLVRQVAFPEHQLLYGVNPAVFDGVAAVELTSGETFSGIV